MMMCVSSNYHNFMSIIDKHRMDVIGISVYIRLRKVRNEYVI